jgi:hypothetical protein
MVQPASALSTPLLRDSGCPEDERRVLALTVSPSVEESIAEESTSWVGAKTSHRLWPVGPCITAPQWPLTPSAVR